MKEIEEFARFMCLKDDDPSLYHHVQLVKKYAVKLARIEKADIYVCEIAALLHDIGKCRGREHHHIIGRDLAETFLKPLNSRRKETIDTKVYINTGAVSHLKIMKLK